MPTSNDPMFTGSVPLPYKGIAEKPLKASRETLEALDTVKKQVDQGRAIPGTVDKPGSPPRIPSQAAFLLRTAGRCDHPRCNAIREQGLHLMKAAGTHISMDQLPAPIPSVASYKKTYSMKDGKQDRKNVEVVQTLRPKDPKHPEWVQATTEAKGGFNIFDPSDLLEHHHGPEDHDFQKYPLPWQ